MKQYNKEKANLIDKQFDGKVRAESDEDEEKIAIAIEMMVLENQVIAKNKNEFAQLYMERKFNKNANKTVSVKTSQKTESRSRTGQWKWVHFERGYCVFKPNVVIGGAKVAPQKIIIPNCNEMMNECIKKYSDALLPFTWRVNEQNEAVVNEEEVLNLAVERFMYRDRKKYKNIFRKHLMKWENVTKKHMVYTFQFKFDSFELPAVTIQGDAYSPAIHDMIKYSDQLPCVFYRVSEDFNIVDFEYDNFMKALEECKNILIKKYGDKWIEARNKRYNTISDEKIVDEFNESTKGQQPDLQSAYGDLASKVLGSSLFSTEFELQWDDVKFYDRHYIFEPKLEDKIRRFQVEPLKKENCRCRYSFNSIVNLFKDRLPKITYRITKDFKIKISNDPVFEDALIFLAKANREKHEYDEFEHTTKRLHKLSFSEAMSKASAITVEELIKNKTEYFNFLIAHQMKEYKVVPVVENVVHTIGKHYEDSFMFTLKSHDGQSFIVVENVNIARATMVFKVITGQYEKALRAVFDYVQSDRVNKRSAVRSSDIDFKNSGVVQCKSIDHDSLNDWKRSMLKWFR